MKTIEGLPQAAPPPPPPKRTVTVLQHQTYTKNYQFSATALSLPCLMCGQVLLRTSAMAHETCTMWCDDSTQGNYTWKSQHWIEGVDDH